MWKDIRDLERLRLIINEDEFSEQVKEVQLKLVDLMEKTPKEKREELKKLILTTE